MTADPDQAVPPLEPERAGPWTRRAVALGLGTAYFGQFVTSGLFLPFLPLWLETRRLGPIEIGIVVAMPAVLRSAVLPLIGIVLDRSGPIERQIRILAAATAACFLLIPPGRDFAAILVPVVLVCALWAPGFPLLDVAALRARVRHGIDYGRARLWGSLGYMAANLLGGAVIALSGAPAAVWVVFAGFALYVPASLALRPQPAEDAATRPRGGLGGPLTQPEVVLVLLAAAAVQGSHAVLNGFGSIIWAGRGLSATAIGVLWALAIIGETMLFWFSGRLAGRIAAPGLIVIGGLAAAVRFALMALSPPLWTYPVLQLLHGLTFAATHIGTVLTIARRAPAGRAAAMQSVQVAVTSASAGLLGIAAGWLFAALGAGSFWVMAGIGLAGAAIAALALRR